MTESATNSMEEGGYMAVIDTTPDIRRLYRHLRRDCGLTRHSANVAILGAIAATGDGLVGLCWHKRTIRELIDQAREDNPK